ncbi:MAG: polyphosphate kinase 1, partial [Flavobacteriales bacterium]|nr:polyphosphate kinase 1 [Flavobacteriales bacterium]
MARSKKIINREISWLAFNERVLNEAADNSVPLLERLKFLGIFSNNRDEFFRVRVASVRRQVALNERGDDPEVDPKEVLSRIQDISLKQQKRYEAIYEDIIKELNTQGIRLVNEVALNQKHRDYIEEYFRDVVDRVMSPIMLDQIKDFPHLNDRAIYLAVSLTLKKSSGKSANRYALIEIPAELPRFVP